MIRPYSHSLSDDERLYRPDVERQRDAARDPLNRMQLFLIREGILDENSINRLEKQVEDEMQVAVDRALEAKFPRLKRSRLYLLAGSRSDFGAFDTPPVFPQAETPPTERRLRLLPKTMAELINGPCATR